MREHIFTTMDDATRIRLQETLNRAVERALTITNAAGAAVALEWEGEMRCRASSGALAPPFGAPVSSDSGISGECIRFGKRLCAHDTEQDIRVNREVCRQLEIRSVMVAPVRQDQQIVGIVEVFSRQPAAFGYQQQDQLELLADAVGRALEENQRPAPEVAEIVDPEPRPWAIAPQSEEVRPPAVPPSLDPPVTSVIPPVMEPYDVPEVAAAPPMFASGVGSHSWLDGDLKRIGVFLGSGVGLVALLLVSVRILHRAELRTLLSPVRAAASPVPSPEPQVQDTAASAKVDTRDPPTASRLIPQRIAKPLPGKPLLRGHVSPAAKRVVEFKAPNLGPQSSPRSPAKPAPSPATNSVPNPAVGATSPSGGTHQVPPSTQSVPPPSVEKPAPSAPNSAALAISGGRLLHRVEPAYPDDARLKRLQGTVALHALIAEDGSVQEVSVVSGDPTLARSAVVAVSQWRYEPYSLGGKVIRVPIDITVDFKLP